jgi:ribosomal protein S18 acetylase RimI-like enzyme
MPVTSAQLRKIVRIAKENEQTWFMDREWFQNRTFECKVSSDGFMIYNNIPVPISTPPAHVHFGDQRDLRVSGSTVYVQAFHVEFVLVDAGHRKKGQCSKMLRELVSDARAHEMRYISLETEQDKVNFWYDRKFRPYLGGNRVIWLKHC